MSTSANHNASTDRADASRANGKKSLGPVSTLGKTVAAMNGVTHGLASRTVLLPSETTTDYEANVNAWATTLQPSSPGEVELVARVADLNFRLRRLQRLEDKHQAASLESKLKESDVSKVLVIAWNASHGMAAMMGMSTSRAFDRLKILGAQLAQRAGLTVNKKPRKPRRKVVPQLDS